MKILVIEDTPANMKLVCDLLRHSGYTVLSAVDADQGIDLARQELPDLVLMDIQLPGMDGITATRLLKNDEATRHIKIIALTAFAMKGDREKMLAAGCDDYIAKPIRYKEFLETISVVAGRGRRVG
ncbi:MAG: response regulator [Proteobacteria bacterium]|nr:response regulator [Desulfobulbaceae bacterium]MBU4153701.1 response regulator [Pseudomonadota bacterium]MDP2104740.1 response regulator [Desulfobulbaceae bacterium]